jgi:hypothetical protein
MTERNVFIEGGDGRGAWARRCNDVIFAHASDLGGPEALSEAQVSICRRVSAIECQLEAMEALMSQDQPVNRE